MFPVHLRGTAVPKLRLPSVTYMFPEDFVSIVIFLMKQNALPPSSVLNSRYMKCKFICAYQIFKSVGSANCVQKSPLVSSGLAQILVTWQLVPVKML